MRVSASLGYSELQPTLTYTVRACLRKIIFCPSKGNSEKATRQDTNQNIFLRYISNKGLASIIKNISQVKK